MEDPRPQSTMQIRPSGFQSRASRFLQKVSNFGRSHKTQPPEHDGPYKKHLRSMDLGPKPYMSQPALTLQSVIPVDNDDSSQSDDNSPPRRSIQLSNEHSKPLVPPKPSKHTPSLSTGVIMGGHAAVTVGVRPPAEGLPVVFSGPIPSPKPTQVTTTETIGKVMVIDKQHSTTPAEKPSPSLPQGAAMPRPPRGSIADRPPPPRMMASASLPASTSTAPPRLPSLRLSNLPPSSLNRFSMNLDGTARLTPSLITRHPLPIHNLPTLPPSSPAVPSRNLRLRASLRAMPALPLKGSDDPDHESDHENSGLGDTDDEDDGDADGDAETEPEIMETGSAEAGSDEDMSESGPGSSHHAPSVLPSIDTTRIDLSFFAQSPRRARVGEGDATPTAATHSSRDYFGFYPNHSGSPARTPTRTPCPDDKHPPRLISEHPSFVARVVPMPATPIGSRPGIYKHGSKSMVDILSDSKRECMAAATAVVEAEVERRKSVVKGKGKAREPSNSPERVDEDEPSTQQNTIGATPAYDSLSNALRRRRSMPTFNPATLPPPYPSFAPHPMRQDIVIQPRDDEGRERLPPYTNNIYLTAIMPRKLEFTAPGVQAKDRKWHRVFCVLEGTSFRVYKCSRALGVGILGQWWEKRVGVGDAAVAGPSSSTRPAVPKKPVERPVKLQLDAEGSLVDDRLRGRASDAPQSPPTPEARTSKRLGLRLQPGVPSAQSHSRSRSDMPGHTSPRPSLNPLRGSSYPSSANLSVMVPSSASSQLSSVTSPGHSRSHFRSNSSQVSSEELSVDPPISDIIRSYTLQNAESGLGNDYVKRQHVIRVRLEGEQFLLQATDVGAVVDWIEGFQAATNIALDLDERPMPKGPSFPRRRRRRPAGNTARPSNNASAATSNTLN